MRNRVLLGIAALLVALLAALIIGLRPSSVTNRSIAANLGAPLSNSDSAPAVREQPPAATAHAPDFASRARAALALSLDQKRGAALQAIIAEWMASDPLACLAFLEGPAANDPMRASLSLFAIERWLAIDEARAREWVLARVRSDDRVSEFYLQPVFALAEKNGGIPALQALLRELPTSDNVYAALTRIAFITIIQKKEQAVTAAFIREIPNERVRSGYWRLLGGTLARQRGAAILDQIASDGAFDGLPGEAGMGAVGALLRSDLVATGRWLARQPIAPAWDGARFNQGLLEMDASPELAIQTAALISDEQRRNELYRHSLSRWAGKDYTAATEWAAASSLPADLVAEALIRGQPIRDPAHYERELQTAANTPDPKARMRAQYQVLRRWLLADRIAARNWIVSSNLPDDMKQALLGVSR